MPSLRHMVKHHHEKHLQRPNLWTRTMAPPWANGACTGRARFEAAARTASEHPPSTKAGFGTLNAAPRRGLRFKLRRYATFSGEFRSFLAKILGSATT